MSESRNLRAFLDMLARSEGTSTSKHTKYDGYDVIVGGLDSPNVFRDFHDHPNVLVTVNNKGLKSTAAGRYQLLYRFWKAYKSQLKLRDFGPAAQDAVAIQQIRERRALDDVNAGRIREAIEKCSNIWASLPGKLNTYGQPMHQADKLVDWYRAFGGTLA